MRILFAVVFVSFFILSASAQTAVNTQRSIPSAKQHPRSTPYSVVNRDANSRTWERTTYEKAPDGQWIPRTHRVVELGTGMHYKDATGNWVESNEQIDLMPDGTAQAVHGQHQVHFPPDIYNGVLELVTPDGKHLKI